MPSIIHIEKSTACRYCNGTVFSDNPICGKCGLEMNSEGIIELAEAEEECIAVLDKLHRLKLTSKIFLIFTIVGFAYSYAFNLTFVFHLYFWMGFMVVFLGFLGWNEKYKALDFSSEDIKIIKKQKREILILFFCNVITGFAMYIFLFS